MSNKSDCGQQHRTHDYARQCKCDGCKRWWAANTPGYFLCPQCNEIRLTAAEKIGNICESCVDENIDEQWERDHPDDFHQATN